MTEERKEHKHRVQDGVKPDYKAFHEVHITSDLASERKEEVAAFVGEKIAEYKGVTEDKAGIPYMLFEREQDARKFADELSKKFDIQKEHITIKARKFTR